ncbi:MAG: EthD domain-containing protein [Candidatus Tectomicrobia bacterium]|uniref:EthD domain-containing protein n=1 Tax=Tectimicrobiota bacterium TaxID=2528274 RepID=A0A932CRA7_UNCTE|nr:EthD domain-containing protein [Candidatus Tectomicrobia bacterium]
MVKLVGCLRRKPGMSAEEFHRYWKDVHGPLVKSVPEFFRYVCKYVQGHYVPDHVPGFPPPPFTPFDGIAELWFDSVEDIGKAFSEPRYLEIIRPDELKFLDLPNCTIFIVEEVVMYG